MRRLARRQPGPLGARICEPSPRSIFAKVGVTSRSKPAARFLPNTIPT
jgi:hypothetical protein